MKPKFKLYCFLYFAISIFGIDMSKNFLLFLGALFFNFMDRNYAAFFGVAYPGYTILDTETGWGLRPDSEAKYTQESRAYIKINKFGMRDKDRILKKPENTYRIAILGDSFMEGFAVELEDIFNIQLENNLSQCNPNSENIEVLNFGVSGYGTIQSLQQYKHYVKRFNPDLVVLAFDTVNDVRDNYFPLSPHKTRPFFQQDNLNIDLSFRDTPFFVSRQKIYWRIYYDLLSNSRILQFIRNSLNDIKHNKSARRIDNFISYLPPQTKNWKTAWKHTENAIVEVRDEVLSTNAEFILLVLGTGIQIHPDRQLQLEKSSEYQVRDWLYQEDRLTEFSKKHDIQIYKLSDKMMKEAQLTKKSLHYLSDVSRTWGHWNTEGHHFAAETFAAYLCHSFK